MNTDPLEDLGDRGLAEFFSHLTSEPTPDELSGEYGALTMFRAARTVPVRRHARQRIRIGGRLVAAGSVVALAGGFAVAGYADVLPAPIQQAIHGVFGFAGVPPSTNSRAPTVPATTSSHASPGTPGSSSTSPGRSTSPRHRSSGSPSHRIAPISLVEQSRGHGQPAVLLVSAPQAQQGDRVELEALVGGQWQVERTHPLRGGGQTAFSVAARKISVTYRVVLLATARHGQSVSDPVTVAARPHQRTKRLRGGEGGQAFPAQHRSHYYGSSQGHQ